MLTDPAGSAVDGPYNESCVILYAISEGKAAGLTSTAVIEEVWHIERSGKAGDISSLADNAYTLFAGRSVNAGSPVSGCIARKWRSSNVAIDAARNARC